MTKPRARKDDTLTPAHRIPTGHETKRGQRVMRDKRARKTARSTVRARGWS